MISGDVKKIKNSCSFRVVRTTTMVGTLVPDYNQKHFLFDPEAKTCKNTQKLDSNCVFCPYLGAAKLTLCTNTQ